MGAILQNRYEQVGQEFGPVGRMKLAMLTKISSIKAAAVEDSPENIRMVDNAIEELRKAS